MPLLNDQIKKLPRPLEKGKKKSIAQKINSFFFFFFYGREGGKGGERQNACVFPLDNFAPFDFNYEFSICNRRVSCLPMTGCSQVTTPTIVKLESSRFEPGIGGKGIETFTISTTTTKDKKKKKRVGCLPSISLTLINETVFIFKVYFGFISLLKKIICNEFISS